MNPKIKIEVCVAIAVFFLCVNIAFAQFQPILFSANSSWRTQANPPVGAIGIGQFPNNTNLPAALTINTNLLTAPGSPRGEVFRTDAPAGQNTFWRMFRGGNEQFALYTPDSSNNVILQVSQEHGSLILKDYKNEITLDEIIELKKQVQELKALLAAKD